MKKKTSVVSVTLLSLAANIALAEESYQAHDHEPSQHPASVSAPGTVSAPEIDPGQAMGALALLGGTMAIVRGYRRNKK